MSTARAIVVLSFSFVLQWPLCAAAEPIRVLSEKTGIAVAVRPDGSFEITARAPAWTFAGRIGSNLSDLQTRRGRDRAGDYREVAFRFRTSTSAARPGAIRLYERRP